MSYQILIQTDLIVRPAPIHAHNFFSKYPPFLNTFDAMLLATKATIPFFIKKIVKDIPSVVSQCIV